MGDAHPAENKDVKVSVVIPAYNEAKIAGGALARVISCFSGRHPFEIIAVDDGSDRVSLLSNNGNRVKGFSVRRGLEIARGDVTLVMAMDMPSPPEESEKFLNSIEGGARIVIASRHAPGSEHRGPGFPDAAISRMFNIMTQLLHGLAFSAPRADSKL